MSNEWIEWNGGECPVERGTLVDVRYRSGDEKFGLFAGVHAEGGDDDAGPAYWEHDDFYNDIVAYRLSE